MKILYCISSVGLGHVRRSIALASEIEKNFDVNIDFLAAEPAIKLLEYKNLKVLPESYDLNSLSPLMENLVNGGCFKFEKVWYILVKIGVFLENIRIVQKVISGCKYDAFVCDEFWEAFFTVLKAQAPKVFITDFLELEGGRKLLGRLFAPLLNLLLYLFLRNFDGVIYYGVGRTPKHFRVIYSGTYCYVDSKERKRVRKELGFRPKEKIILVTAGGTALNSDILGAAAKAYELLKKKVTIRMLLVTGPRIDSNSIKTSTDIEIKGFLPNMDEYILASDIVISHAGRAVLTEIEHSATSGIVVPIDGHLEQEELAIEYKQKPNFLIIRRKNMKPIIMVRAIEKMLKHRSVLVKAERADVAARALLDFLKTKIF